jgi:signal transduction histidine kinase
MVQRAIARATPLVESTGGRVLFDSSVRVGTLQTDTHRVEQILLNLLSNAIQHSPGGSAVEIRLLAEQGRVRLEVLDQGPGVPESDLDRVFDIYQTKGSETGVGLGLPVSRRLARLLGGELRAETREAGGGCFILELPSGEILKTST